MLGAFAAGAAFDPGPPGSPRDPSTEDFTVNDIEFRNITSGHNVISIQKMELVHKLDSLNNDLKNSLTALIN